MTQKITESQLRKLIRKEISSILLEELDLSTHYRVKFDWDRLKEETGLEVRDVITVPVTDSLKTRNYAHVKREVERWGRLISKALPEAPIATVLHFLKKSLLIKSWKVGEEESPQWDYDWPNTEELDAIAKLAIGKN